MNRKIGEIFERASQSLDMPLSVAAGMPRLELRGSGEIILENHRGVREYGEETLIVSTDLGLLHICGSGLMIRAMNEDRMIINGEIRSIQYAEEI